MQSGSEHGSHADDSDLDVDTDNMVVRETPARPPAAAIVETAAAAQSLAGGGAGSNSRAGDDAGGAHAESARPASAGGAKHSDSDSDSGANQDELIKRPCKTLKLIDGGFIKTDDRGEQVCVCSLCNKHYKYRRSFERHVAKHSRKRLSEETASPNMPSAKRQHISAPYNSSALDALRDFEQALQTYALTFDGAQTIIANFRESLRFLAPPNWSMSAEEIAQMDLNALSSFPLDSFLEAYDRQVLAIRAMQHTALQRRVAQAEEKTAQAQAAVDRLRDDITELRALAHVQSRLLTPQQKLRRHELLVRANELAHG